MERNNSSLTKQCIGHFIINKWCGENTMSKLNIFSNWTSILLMIATISSCNVFSATQQTFDCTELKILSVKEAYAQVDYVAKKWDKDAYLEEVLLYLYPKTDKSTLLATFGYRSLSSPFKAVSFDYIARSDIEIEQREFSLEDSEPPVFRLDLVILQLDSLDALKIMCEQLGNEFYKTCKVGHWPLPMTLKYGFPGISKEEVWVMSFACDKPEKGAAIIINATSGEVLEIRQ